MGELCFRDEDRPGDVDGWGAAAGRALRKAVHRTGRPEVAVPCLLAPERLALIRAHCGPDVSVVVIGQSAGRIDLGDLRARTSDATAAVYLETPNHLGTIEVDVPEIVDMARRLRALSVVGVDPASLGVLPSPSADVVVGPTRSVAANLSEVGEELLRNSGYLAARVGSVQGVRVRWPGFFRRFVVDFNGTGRSVEDINSALGGRGIVGGRDLSVEFPWLGQAALYSVGGGLAEEDVEMLVRGLGDAVAG